MKKSLLVKSVLMLPLLLAACGQQNAPGGAQVATFSADVAPTDVTAATAWAQARADALRSSASPVLTAQMADEGFGRTKIGTMATANICTMVADRLNETSNGSASYSCSGRSLYMDY